MTLTSKERVRLAFQPSGTGPRTDQLFLQPGYRQTLEATFRP